MWTTVQALTMSDQDDMIQPSRSQLASAYVKGAQSVSSANVSTVRCHEHSAVTATELLQPLDLHRLSISLPVQLRDLQPLDLHRLSISLPVQLRDLQPLDLHRLSISLPVQLRNPDITYGLFRGKHERGALWLLIYGTLEKHLLPYLFLQFFAILMWLCQSINFSSYRVSIRYQAVHYNQQLTLNSSKPFAPEHKTNIKSLVLLLL